MEIIPTGFCCDIEKFACLCSFVVLLRSIKVSNFRDSFVRPYDMNLRLRPELISAPVLKAQRAWLPGILKTEAATAESVSLHLFSGKGLPQVRSHSEFLDREVEAVAFALHTLRRRIVCPWRVPSENDGKLKRWSL